MSTFPINPNIPAANNDPADDQPLMQTNFSNINQYVQVDHTNPANVGAGEHKQVTFNANNVPSSFPITPPVLFTNDQDGAGNMLPGSLAQLFYYTGSSTSSQNQYFSTTSGSCLLMGGIIMKWGGGICNNPGIIKNFSADSSAFPNNCFVVVCSTLDPAYSGQIASTSLTSTGFTATRTSGTGVTGYRYIAIGN